MYTRTHTPHTHTQPTPPPTHTHTHLCVNSASQDRGVEQVFWSPHLSTILSLHQTWGLAASQCRGLADNFLNSFPRPSPRSSISHVKAWMERTQMVPAGWGQVSREEALWLSLTVPAHTVSSHSPSLGLCPRLYTAWLVLASGYHCGEPTKTPMAACV